MGRAYARGAPVRVQKYLPVELRMCQLPVHVATCCFRQPLCGAVYITLGVMVTPFPISKLVDEWLIWAAWTTDPKNEGQDNPDLVGFDEFDWVVREHPEHAWQAILATVSDPRAKPHIGTLAAGPMEDLLSFHGEAFIDRIEATALSNPNFAWMLGGVWQFKMSEEVWRRVQAVWDRRGWDGIPKNGRFQA